MSLSWFQFRLRTLLLAIAATAVALFVVDNLSIGIWDGRFNLTVHINQEGRSDIERLSYRVDKTRDMADWIASNPTSPEAWFDPLLSTKLPFFDVYVPCYGRTSTFGRELSYGEFQCLIVKVRYTDGSERCVVFDIPTGRHARAMTITLPSREDSVGENE